MARVPNENAWPSFAPSTRPRIASPRRNTGGNTGTQPLFRSASREATACAVQGTLNDNDYGDGAPQLDTFRCCRNYRAAGASAGETAARLPGVVGTMKAALSF